MKTHTGLRAITKIKFSKGRMHIEYEMERPGGEPDVFTLDTGDQPHPDFVRALEALRPHVVDLTELPPDVENRLTVCGVSLSSAEDAEDQPVMGATVTALLSLTRSRAPLVLNTPHKPDHPYSADEVDVFCLTEEQVAAIQNLVIAAEAYLDGKRAQASLDFGAGAPAPDGSGPGTVAPKRGRRTVTLTRDSAKRFAAAARAAETAAKPAGQ